MVRFHYGEGIANHIGLKPCAAARESTREASVEGCIGQPLSRDRFIVQGADDVVPSEGNTSGYEIASNRTTLRGLRTWHVQKLHMREPGDLVIDHKTALVRIGKVMN